MSPKGGLGGWLSPKGVWGDGSLPRVWGLGVWGDGSPQKEKKRGAPGVVPGLALREAEAHQVNGVAHEVSAQHGSFGQKGLKVFGTETDQAGPQAHVRGQRGLGLQASQVPDRRGGRPRVAAQQELAAERGAVQRAQGE